MAIPSFVNAGAKAAGAAAVTPALPASLATDDILLLFAESNAGEAVTIPTPNGGTWTEVTGSPQNSSASRLTVFWSRYNGTQGNPTTNDPGDHICCFIAAFRGCITSGNPWDITVGDIENTSDTTLSATGGTTGVADCLVVIACSTGADSNSAQFSAWANSGLANPSTNEPAGCDVCTNAGLGGGVACAVGGKASAGAFGATTATLGTASTKGFLTIALKPPLGADVTFSGTIAGVATAVGAVLLNLALAGTSAGVAAATGLLVADLVLAGTSAGVGAATATLSVDRALSASSAGVGTAAGAFTVDRGLAGTATGAGTATAAASIDLVLAATAAGVGTASAAVVADLVFSGTSACVGEATASLTVDVPPPPLTRPTVLAGRGPSRRRFL